VPLLLLFGGLFMAADVVFRSLLVSAVPSLGKIWVHLAIVGGLTRPQVGATEVTIALGILDLLFAAFVAVQARYLLGWKDLVESRVHLTYAQYVRHGFLELVVVAVLVLPLLLGANVLVRGSDRGARVVRGLSAALVALVLVVMVSALDRMWLYERGYGLTELRIYAIGIILWLACVFLWLLVTVLRGNSSRFATGAIIAGFGATLALNAINPDALIARANLARPHIDAAYVASLSDDALPALLTRLPTLPPALRSQIATALFARDVSSGGFLGWNASRSRAAGLLASYRAELAGYATR
jgi:hypothetical protein